MLLYFIFVPETYSAVILQRKTVRLRRKLNNPHLRSKLDSGLSFRVAFWRAIIRPLRMLILSPIVGSLATLSAVVYGYLYLVFTTLTNVFEEDYGFAPDIVGLTFIGVGLGMMAGVATFGGLSDRIMVRKARANGGELKPEYRLAIMIPGGLCTPVGFFIYGWTAEKHVFWLVPILATSLIGAGVMAYFVGFLLSFNCPFPHFSDFDHPLFFSGTLGKVLRPNNVALDTHPSLPPRRLHRPCRLRPRRQRNLALHRRSPDPARRPAHVQSNGPRLGKLTPRLHLHPVDPRPHGHHDLWGASSQKCSFSRRVR